MRIDTEVPEIIVEIEDKEFTLAPRTVDICDRLTAAEQANVGKPAYKLWMAELEIVLGKAACKELFPDGKAENVDRLQMIYAGVSRAFNRTADEIASSDQERQLEAVATALGPLNEFLRNVRALDKDNKPKGNIREITRS